MGQFLGHCPSSDPKLSLLWEWGGQRLCSSLGKKEGGQDKRSKSVHWGPRWWRPGDVAGNGIASAFPRLGIGMPTPAIELGLCTAVISFFWKKKKIMYLAALDLSCSMQDLQLWCANSSLRHVGSSSLTWTRAPCLASSGCQLLDHQRSPLLMLCLPPLTKFLTQSCHWSTSFSRDVALKG